MNKLSYILPDALPENPVARQLVTLLQQRGLRPGDKLPGEIELATTLHVSRPALREAMGVLEATGLFAARKGSGRVMMPFSFGTAMGLMARYVMPDNKRMHDLLAVRQLLEINMLPIAAAHFSDGDLAALDSIVTQMEAKAAAAKYFGQEDRAFHLALYRSLNNDVLNGILDTFWAMYERLEVSALVHSQKLDETAAHHRRILTALQAGDVRRAQHHLDTHFYDTSFALSQDPADRPASPT